MDGGVAGPGAASLSDSLPRSGVAGGSRASAPSPVLVGDLVEDQIETSLLNLASAQIVELLDRLEQPRLMLDPALLNDLLQKAVAAADTRDFRGSLAAIADVVSLHPERGAQLVRESPSLTPIRDQVTDLLQHLALDAKSEAERTLVAASRAIENAGPSAAGHAASMLALAERFLDTGQHINFVRAAELGQAILAYYPASSIDRNEPVRRSAVTLQRPSTLWRRAPVLVVLGWASLGFLVLLAVEFLLTARP